jgi:hypothetical protein
VATNDTNKIQLRLHGIGDIEEFEKIQRRTREYINFTEIADWCSREGGSVLPDERKRAAALDLLAKDLLAGEFEENGKSLVLYLHPAGEIALVGGKWLKDAINYNWDSDKGRFGFLPYCWMPRQMFEAWLKRHRLAEQLPARFQPSVDRVLEKNIRQKRPRPAYAGGFVRDVIDKAYPNGLPNKKILPNKSFLARIHRALRRLPAKKKPKSLPSDTTILRAAGRKK